jgi:hypothetical protein
MNLEVLQITGLTMQSKTSIQQLASSTEIISNQLTQMQKQID